MTDYYIFYDALTKKYQVFLEHPVHYEDTLMGEWDTLDMAEEYLRYVTSEE